MALTKYNQETTGKLLLLALICVTTLREEKVGLYQLLVSSKTFYSNSNILWLQMATPYLHRILNLGFFHLRSPQAANAVKGLPLVP